MKNKGLLLMTSLSMLLSIALIGCNHKTSYKPIADSDASTASSSTLPSTSINKTVKGVTLNSDKATIKVGKSMTLSPIFNPIDATNRNLTWETSDANIATVNENGVVEGIAAGQATITATTEEGGYKATCLITVIEPSDDPYVPNENDGAIFFVTEDRLTEGVYDANKDEYTFTVSSNYKQIYVNAPNKTIIVELVSISIINDENSPIYVVSCDKLELSVPKGTKSEIEDLRAAYTEDQDDQGKGAIYVADGDLKLKGAGELKITANYYNGIHAKDDVKIQKQTLTIDAVNHGIKANDGIEIVSGTINITCGGDGLHTENTDISSKGNQRGNVVISGGSVTINSWGDAVAAAYNAVIEQAETDTSTSFVAKTNKYSSYTGETVTTSDSTLYLKMNSSTYSNGNYKYAAYINDTWYPATFKGSQSSGGFGGPGGGGPGGGGPGGSTYFYYEIQKPNSATSFTLYRFASNVTEYSLTSYNAKSDAKAFNSAYDTVQISVSSGKISFSSWSNYSSGNNNGAEISAKGIKAENEIYIKAGTINIEAYDDAIHVNNDATLENGTSPVGNVNISGGTLTLKASDDAIHADYTVNISGGKTNVETGYEGIEGNLININGGETYVYATDDGLNVTSGKSSPNITVSGGLLDVAVPSNGDTDGIDSNGTFTQTGGVVIVKGPGSASGNTFGAAALDADGAVTLTKGTLIVFGGIEKTPSTSLTKTLCSSSTVSAGSHTVSFNGGTSYQTTLKSSANGCIAYSELGTATLK